MLPWVRASILAFCDAFVRSDATAWIGVGSREGFEPIDRTRASHRLMRDPSGVGRIALQPGLPLARGFVWLPGGNHPAELWLDPGYGSYRALFERFAQRHLGAPGLSGANVQIDHVFPKTAGGVDRLAYVRMLAIPPDSNMAAGRTVERAMAARARAVAAPKLVRHATFYSIGKATGFFGWRNVPDSASAAANLPAVDALFAHLRAFGLPALVLTGLDRMLTADRLRTLR